MSSAPIGENSVASAIVITPPCPLLKYPAGTFLSTTSMMPPKRGATHPPYELFMDELRRIPLLGTSMNKPPGYWSKAKLFSYGPGPLSHRALRLLGYPLRGDA